MPEDCTVALLSSAAEMQSSLAPWSALWQEDIEATPFQSPEWLLPWWEHFGEGDLRSVALWKAGRMVGLLPFYLYREPSSGERKLLPVGIGTSDYLGGVFSPQIQPHQIVRALEHLRHTEGWDTLYAPQLVPGSRLATAFDSWNVPGLQRVPSQSTSRGVATLFPDLPHKIRRNAVYYRNRAARLGTLELSMADAQTWPGAFDALEALHSARWQQSGEPGVLADPRVRAWHREAIPALLASGLLRFCSLRLNGVTIGVLYGLADPANRPHRTLYCYLTGYSPRHADLSPGTLLLALAIDHAAAHGISVIDMLRGDEPYKQLWHLSPTPTAAFAIEAGAALAQFSS